jgi:hypothetical protein
MAGKLMAGKLMAGKLTTFGAVRRDDRIVAVLSVLWGSDPEGGVAPVTRCAAKKKPPSLAGGGSAGTFGLGAPWPAESAVTPAREPGFYERITEDTGCLRSPHRRPSRAPIPIAPPLAKRAFSSLL